jgi:hypothetical protein
MPFLAPEAGACPVANNQTWMIDANQVGCCPQNAYIASSVPGQIACCPCGSTCGGLPPQPGQSWNVTGKLSISRSFWAF